MKVYWSDLTRVDALKQLLALPPDEGLPVERMTHHQTQPGNPKRFRLIPLQITARLLKREAS